MFVPQAETSFMSIHDEKPKAPNEEQDAKNTQEAERQANEAGEQWDTQGEPKPKETSYDLGDGSDGGAAGDGED